MNVSVRGLWHLIRRFLSSGLSSPGAGGWRHRGAGVPAGPALDSSRKVSWDTVSTASSASHTPGVQVRASMSFSHGEWGVVWVHCVCEAFHCGGRDGRALPVSLAGFGEFYCAGCDRRAADLLRATYFGTILISAADAVSRFLGVQKRTQPGALVVRPWVRTARHLFQVHGPDAQSNSRRA